ncbi:hypothetical protein OA07_08835, partial [Aphanizomenon flos-aquae 2012/KM1/D3]
PKSDSCGALRYRTPTPQTAIAPSKPLKSDRSPTPQTAIPTERFAIAFPHPQTANCLQQRFAIASHKSPKAN